MELDIKQFLLFIIKAIGSFIVIYIIGYYVRNAIIPVYNEWGSFFIIVPLVMSSFAAVYYLFVFDNRDREKVINVIRALMKK